MSSVLDRFGAYIFPWGKVEPTVQSLVDLSIYAEELGYDSVQLPWHFTTPRVRIFPSFGNRTCLDPLVVLPAIAQATERIKLSLNSVVLPLAVHPYLWAKYFASLDQASGGRFIAGAALGWWEEDFQAGGVPLKQAERGKRMDEAMQMLMDLFAGREITQPGRFWDASGLEIAPRPQQDPLPFWIGGASSFAIERAAKWGTGLCPVGMSPPDIARIRAELDEACERHGRQPGDVEIAVVNHIVVAEDPEEIEQYFFPRMLARVNMMSVDDVLAVADRSTLVQPDEQIPWGTPQQCADRLMEYFDAGASYQVMDFNLHGMEDEDFARHQMKRLAEEVAPLMEERCALLAR